MAYTFDTDKFYNKYQDKMANQITSQKKYNKAQYQSNVKSTKGFDYASIAKKVAKKEKEEAESKAQQAEIESQYQAELESNNKRGGLDRVFDVLSTGGYAVNGLLQDGLKGALDGTLAGLDGFNIFNNKEAGKEYSAKDTISKYTGGSWGEYNDKLDEKKWFGEGNDFLGKAGALATNLGAEILLDPLTYLGGAGIVKSVLKGSGKRATGVLGRTAMKEISEEAVVNAGKKLITASGNKVSKEVAEVVAENSARYAQKANKLAGNAITTGDLTFGIGKAKVAIKGTGTALRSVGDATIAPYYNTLQDALKRANVFNPITNNGKLKKQLVEGNLDEFVRLMAVKDREVAMRKLRHAVPNEILGRANNDAKVFNNSASKSNEEVQELMFNILDDDNSYDIVESAKFLGSEGKEMLDNFIEQTAKTAPDAMKDVTVTKVIEKLKQSDNVFDALKNPRDKFSTFVYKKLIDPTNSYDNYADAYTAFVGKYHIEKRVNKVDLEPVKTMAEAVSKKEVSRLTPSAIETGIFVNKKNADNLSAMLKQNKVISKIVKSPTEAKVEYLNDLIFDGKKVVIPNEVAEESVNKALVAIKNGADEGEIINALKGSIDISANHSSKDMFMSADEIAAFEETLALPERYNTVENRIATSGLVPVEGKMRIYNQDTGELFYSVDNLKERVGELFGDVENVSEGVLKENTALVRHTQDTAVERVAKEQKDMTDIKGVVKGEKTIADTDLVETITRQKKQLVEDYITELSNKLPNELKDVVQDDAHLEWFAKNILDENGNVIEDRLANYMGKKSALEYAYANGLPPKDLSKYDSVAYNSLNIMPKVQFSSNFSQTPRQAIRSIFSFDAKAGEKFNESLLDIVNSGSLSDDARALGMMMLNGKFDTFADGVLNTQFVEDFKKSPLYELLTKYADALPQINPKAKDFRKKNAETLVEYFDGLFSGKAKVKYADNILESKESAKIINDIYNAKNGQFYSPEVVKNLMQLEIDLPSEMRTLKDIYTDVVVDADGVVTQITYDPYTMETAQRAISKTVVDNELTYNTFFNQEAQMSKLDYFLNNAYKSDVLDKQFTDFVTSTYNVPKTSQYVVRDGTAYAKQLDRRLNLSAYDLSDEVKHTLQFVFEELRRIGMDEHQAGKLSGLLNNYVPHVINKDMFKNPNIMKAIQKENPELYRMVFKSAGDKFNPHNVGRSGELEETVRKILGDKYAKESKVYTGTGKTVSEVNEALKPLLKSAGFDGDFFVNNLYDAFAQRVTTHGDVLYSDKIIDETLELFGTYVRPDLVNPKKTYYLNQKDLRNFFDGITEDNQYIIMQELGIDIDKTYNKMLIGVKGDKLEKFYNIARKWKEKQNTLPNFVAYELPEQVARFAQNKGYTQALDDTNVALKIIDKFTNLWKQTATVINPAFHVRNSISNSFQSYLNVGGDTFNPQVRKMVKEVLEGKEGAMLLESGKEVPYQLIRDELVARDIISYQNFNRLDNEMASTTVGLFDEELRGSGGVLEAIGRMLGKENPTMLNKLDPTDTANFVGFTAGRNLGSKIEDFDRTLNFISRVKQGESFDVAHEMVNKFLFDYSDLTPFEMNVMKRIVPFYTWLRKNAPLQVEMLFEKPWVYSTIGHTQREMNRGADQTHMPDYMREWFRLPIEFNGNEVYGNISMPYSDLGKDYTDPSTYIGMANPLIKVPLELATNTNNYYGAPIYDESDTMDEGMEKVRDYMKTSLLGGWNTLGNGVDALLNGDAQKKFEKLTPFVTGMTPKVYDKEKEKEDAIYRAIRNMEDVLAKEESSKSTKLNKTFEEYKQTKLEKYGYSSDK